MARIYQRGSVWYSDFMVDGKKVRKALSTDKNRALTKLGEMIKDRDAGKFGYANSDMSYAGFEEKYLAHRKPIMRRNTYDTDKRALRLFRELIPITKISQVTPESLDRFVGLLKGRGYKAVNLNRIVRAIVTAMGKAQDWGLRQTIEWSRIQKLKEPKSKLLFYTVQELDNLIKFCHGPWLTIALLGSRVGLRRGEMYHLAWEDVDFIRGRIHIVGKDGWQPKDYEQRWIPMPPDVRNYLSSLAKDSRWVLGNDRPTEGRMTKCFSRLSRKAGLKGSVHTLRHTYASHLAQLGESLYKIQHWLGHSDHDTTQKYSHLVPDIDRGGVDKLPKLDIAITDDLNYNPPSA